MPSMAQHVTLPQFCAEVFSVMRRSDQRRAAETYMRGLLSTGERKSVRRIAETVGTHSDQALQQFVNQSPWDSSAVRHRILESVVRAERPVAWAIQEVAFVKHGRQAAGVARQYARSLEKVANCQIALAVTVVTDSMSVPVNWRLVLPKCWDDDHTLRTRAGVPAGMRSEPLWEAQVAALDEMLTGWGIPMAPVLVDATQTAAVDSLLSALGARGIPYAACVHGNIKVRYRSPGPAARGALRRPEGYGAIWHKPAEELVSMVKPPRRTVAWQRNGLVMQSQFAQMDIEHPPANSLDGHAQVSQEPQQLLADWPLGLPAPRHYWITNIGSRDLPEIVTLLKHPVSSGDLFQQMESMGLRDYEGRTYRGWHHHMTLVSAAQAYSSLRALAGPPGQRRR
jgi:DDE superfamily endonuclease